jgi:hypothetical protein
MVGRRSRGKRVTTTTVAAVAISALGILAADASASGTAPCRLPPAAHLLARSKTVLVGATPDRLLACSQKHQKPFTLPPIGDDGTAEGGSITVDPRLIRVNGSYVAFVESLPLHPSGATGFEAFAYNAVNGRMVEHGSLGTSDNYDVEDGEVNAFALNRRGTIAWISTERAGPRYSTAPGAPEPGFTPGSEVGIVEFDTQTILATSAVDSLTALTLSPTAVHWRQDSTQQTHPL